MTDTRTQQESQQPAHRGAPVAGPLDEQELAAVDAWWRACNYLAVGQIYLQANPLLRRPLEPGDIKPRLLGHWGTSPGLAFIYAHVSRLIRRAGQRTIFLTGPGHGGPAIVGASWLDGTYSEIYPAIAQNESGMSQLFRQFSTPGGVPSHVSATTPGSIHEGGELGYVLMHAFGAVMDDPDLLAVAVVGDGEAETAALEGSWKGISFLDPVHDGAVLPVLHLNGYKISGPTVLARKPPEEVRSLFTGHGYTVIEVTGDDLPGMHQRFAAALDRAHAMIRDIQEGARSAGRSGRRARWPMIILRSPKGWTGPAVVDDIRVEGTWRSHQVPLPRVRENRDHLLQLAAWLQSYHPEELFDDGGGPTPLVLAAIPSRSLRMSAVDAANGGQRTRDLIIPELHPFAVDLREEPGLVESTRRLGRLLATIYRANPATFRLFCPDETSSNRLDDVFAVTDRAFQEHRTADDVSLSPSGRVMEVLSENNCQGWLEGYSLSGRHGIFATYEAFAMVSASQMIQHGKWLEEADQLPWRAPVPSLNILLTSTVWRNDHNGFSHQGPGLIQTALTERSDVSRVYLPPDGNTLLVVAEHCLRSRSRVNLVVIDKQPQPQWLSLEEARSHVARGASRWHWAGSEAGGPEPDIVLACAGDAVTAEAVAAAEILSERLPEMLVRVVNVVDLMSLCRPADHPHGISEIYFRELFGSFTEVLFAFHGYPGAVHQLLHGRPNSDRFHVRGYTEHGTTTTPFDMVVLNKVSRFDLVIDAIANSHRSFDGAAETADWCRERLRDHHDYIRAHLEDLPEIRQWRPRRRSQPPKGQSSNEEPGQH
ncbi:MAG TPA: phosphoketolase family protein [Microlunatus sp.]